MKFDFHDYRLKYTYTNIYIHTQIYIYIHKYASLKFCIGDANTSALTQTRVYNI